MRGIPGYEFNPLRSIHEGKFGSIRKGFHQSSKDVVAIKSFVSSKGKYPITRNELTILQQTNHRNIIQFFDWYEDDEENIFIVTEYCNVGNLADFVRTKGTLSERAVSHLLKQLVSALEELRRLRIVHCDINPTNILLSQNVFSMEKYPKRSVDPLKVKLKVSDFTTGVQLHTDTTAVQPIYFTKFMAPEILLEKPYGFPVDLWGLGYTAYVCLTGHSPCTEEDTSKLREFYAHTEFLTIYVPRRTSKAAISLVQNLLVKTPYQRSSLEDISRNFLFTGEKAADPMIAPIYETQIIRDDRKFQEACKPLPKEKVVDSDHSEEEFIFVEQSVRANNIIQLDMVDYKAFRRRESRGIDIE